MTIGHSWSRLMKTFDSLDKVFDTQLPTTTETQLPVAVIPNTGEDAKDDYEATRATLHRLMTKGEDALDNMLQIAKVSEHPRTFEVTGQLIKTVSEVAKDLMSLQKQIKDLKTPEQEKQTQNIQQQNNILFTGTTDDLLKQMQQLNSKTIDG